MIAASMISAAWLRVHIFLNKAQINLDHLDLSPLPARHGWGADSLASIIRLSKLLVHAG